MEELESKIREIEGIFQVAREYSTSTIQAMGYQACDEARALIPTEVDDEEPKTKQELARVAYKALLKLQNYNLAAEVKKKYNL